MYDMFDRLIINLLRLYVIGNNWLIDLFHLVSISTLNVSLGWIADNAKRITTER